MIFVHSIKMIIIARVEGASHRPNIMKRLSLNSIMCAQLFAQKYCFQWVFVAMLLVLGGCSDPQQITASEMSDIVALGHGGMGISSAFPLNSQEGIEKCLSLGLDGTELDVQLTADSVLVAFHDADLGEDTKLEGRIHGMTWEQLQETKFTGALRTSCEVVSLDDLFSGIDDLRRFKFTFDCKLHPVEMMDGQYHAQFVGAIYRLLSKHSLGSAIAIESQDVAFLKACRLRLPTCGYYYYPSTFEDGFSVAVDAGFDGITIDADEISKAQIDELHAAGLKVAVWNVQSPSENWDAINKRPDFIQTDEPKHLQRVLKNF